MRFPHPWRKYDDRVEDARREVHASQKRLDATRKEVAEPLVREGRHNQFAEIIRSSLINGNGKARDA